ncbi:hypothetical protein [Prochlorococcus sp. ALOHA_ZT_50]|uniref:hypothetical protein n=1 Tax=Prochlorococcus sp. ALOHA_ZT_50 TaxID=2919303 RepID=UPI00257FF068|nr:hypothetical protein [Prochlorococcus sp. ALOHA_ZT_50]MCH2079567.1 hypothetical protein [Prochlorococcus sp. ALOHA_ZT_50]
MVIKRITKKKQKQVNELIPTSFKFLSPVDNPANEEAVDVVKSREKIEVIEKKKKLAEMLDGENIAPVEFQFSKDFYENEDRVKAWLSDEGYEGFSVTENDEVFIVKADKDLEVEAIKTSAIQREDGVTAIVKEFDFSDLEENTIEEIKGLQKEEATPSEEVTESEEGGEPATETQEDEVAEEVEGQKEEPIAEDVATEGEQAEGGETEPTIEGEGETVEGEVEETKGDNSDIVLMCRGKNILEITKGMKKSLDYLQNVKEVKKDYSEYLGAYYGAETIQEALAIGGYDGGFPGMDEVMDTLEEFIKCSLLKGNLEGARGAFDVAANYINDLKGIYDTYADSETLAMFTERMMSAPVEEESNKSTETKTESLDNALLKEIHKELLVLNSASDLQKSEKEDITAKITQLEESYSKDFTNLGDKLDKISGSFEEFVSIEQTRVKSSLPAVEVDNSGESQDSRKFVLKDI